MNNLHKNPSVLTRCYTVSEQMNFHSLYCHVHYLILIDGLKPTTSFFSLSSFITLPAAFTLISRVIEVRIQGSISFLFIIKKIVLCQLNSSMFIAERNILELFWNDSSIFSRSRPLSLSSSQSCFLLFQKYIHIYPLGQGSHRRKCH